jgi:hypothetical protein
MTVMPKGGRTKGSRNKLSAQVIEDILAEWREHGPAAIRIMRIEEPGAFVRVVVSTLPKELIVESAMADLDDEELDALIDQLKHIAIASRQEAPMLIEAKPERIKAAKGKA